MEVICQGDLTCTHAWQLSTGDPQIEPKGVGRAGIGTAAAARAVDGRGLFAAERSAPCPAFPRRVALSRVPAARRCAIFWKSCAAAAAEPRADRAGRGKGSAAAELPPHRHRHRLAVLPRLPIDCLSSVRAGAVSRPVGVHEKSSCGVMRPDSCDFSRGA